MPHERPAHLTILGAGAWGTTLALLADRAGADVTLVAHRHEDARVMAERRRHPRSLPGLMIPPGITLASLGDDLPASDLMVVAVPTQNLRSALALLPAPLADAPIVSAAKGIELGTLLRPSQVIADVLHREPGKGIVVLSGPNLATEIAEGLPAAAVVAGNDAGLTRTVQRTLGSSRFRLYTGGDPAGVELGGALKNIVAIGAG
ncbi:MAG: NAD(P)H-dependent glycerol-3-phosphate dehydrogenase, partial [Thermomicrobiales bacterium]